MSDDLRILETEGKFFAALIAGDVAGLDAVLTDDFLLVDVMSGGMVEKKALLEVIGGGQLGFEKISPSETRVRQYAGTAIITGRTEMAGAYTGQGFVLKSRYTHVYVERDGRWQMASAQGTPITGG